MAIRLGERVQKTLVNLGIFGQPGKSGVSNNQVLLWSEKVRSTKVTVVNLETDFTNTEAG